MRFFKSVFLVTGFLLVSVTQNHAQTLVRGPGSAALDPLFRQVLAAPNDIELNMNFARRAIELEDYEAAVATLERLLIGRTDLPLIRLELGMLYLRLEAPELAEAYFLQALDAPNMPEEARARAQVLLVETRKASAKGSFAASFSIGVKHSSNAATKPELEDSIAENNLRQQILPVWPNISESDYANLTPSSDAATTGSLGLSYSRELDGLTERRFNISVNHYASGQHGEDMEMLDIGVTSLRMGFVLPITRRGKQPISIDPYLSASSLDTDAENGFSTTGTLGLSISGYASRRRPIALTLEAGHKTHKLDRDENKDGGRYNIGFTLGHIHSGGGYSSFGLKFDTVDTDNDFENLNGGNFTASHSRPLGGFTLGANIGWRESKRDGYQPAPPGAPQIEERRYDKDLSAGLSLSRSIFGVAINLGVNYIRRDSNIPAAQYDDTTGSLTFSRSFQ